MHDDQLILLPRLLSQNELCEYIGKSQAWAERARLEGNGPPFVKIGRSILYRAADVEDWIESRMRRHTGPHGG